MKIIIALTILLLTASAFAQVKEPEKPIDEKPIEEVKPIEELEVEKTKDPLIKTTLTTLVAKQVTDSKAFTVPIKDVVFVDSAETKEVRGIVHHRHHKWGYDTLIIIDDVTVRGKTINGVFTCEGK